MPQGPIKKSGRQRKTEERHGRQRTQKGKVFKPPKKSRAKRKFEMDSAVHKYVTEKTERETSAMVAKEGVRMKILETPPILAAKKRRT